MDYIENLEMVETVKQINPHLLKVILDSMENGMWFRDSIANYDYEVIDSSHSKPVFWVEVK